MGHSAQRTGRICSSGRFFVIYSGEDEGVRLTYVSIGYLLLAVVSGVVYGFSGTILKKGVGFRARL
jgi:hypothetical protein